MLSKTVGCWSYSAWVKLTLFYEPIPKGGIPREQHPAIIEDAWLAQPTTVNQGRRTWKQGRTRAVVENYLRMNGPATIKEISEDTEGTLVQITSALRNHGETFEVVGHKTIHVGYRVVKAAIWDVRKELFHESSNLQLYR